MPVCLVCHTYTRLKSISPSRTCLIIESNDIILYTPHRNMPLYLPGDCYATPSYLKYPLVLWDSNTDVVSAPRDSMIKDRLLDCGTGEEVEIL